MVSSRGKSKQTMTDIYIYVYTVFVSNKIIAVDQKTVRIFLVGSKIFDAIQKS